MKAGQLVNGIVILLVSVVAFLGSVFALSEEEVELEEGWHFSGTLGFDEAIDANLTPVTARLNGRDSVTLLPGAVAEFSWDEEAGHLDLDLESGEVVFGAVAGDFTLSVNTDFARVDSQNSTAYVAVGDGEMNVYATEHPSLVTFVQNGEDLNSISVPMNYRMKVPESKISETIGKLRLTKLSKEFPVYELETDDISTEVENELDEIDFVYTEDMTETMGAILGEANYGPSKTGLFGSINELYEEFRDAVTFMPHADARFEMERMGELLSYAMTNALYGDEELGEVWLDEWLNADHDAEDVAEIYASLFFAMPGSELYPVKSALADVLYADEETMTRLRLNYLEIETLLAISSKVLAEEAYKEYKSEFQAALNSGVFDDEKWLDEISREYMLLELMLRSHSIFYSVDSASLLLDLEEKILALAGSGQDLDEERQAFVQSKLRFLEDLFSFVVDKKVSVDDATELADELLASAESYLNAVASTSAVQEYYESKLEYYDLATAFMNSPEFYSYASFEEGVEAHSEKVDDLDELNEYIQNLRSEDSEEVEEITLEEASEEVLEDLLFAGVTYSDVVSLGDAANRLFEIQGGHVGGYEFEANYDRGTGLLYDIAVEDVRFSTGVLLDDIREVIEVTFEEDMEEELGEVVKEDERSSLAEDLALAEAKKAFEEVGLEGFEIELVDLDGNLFFFKDSITRSNFLVSGFYDLVSGQASDIEWEINGGIQSMPDLDLSQLETAIEVTAEALLAD